MSLFQAGQPGLTNCYMPASNMCAATKLSAATPHLPCSYLVELVDGFVLAAFGSPLDAMHW
jgi:hypothetical protein